MGERREYRCTRPDLYTADCPGRDNPWARQGYYVRASSMENAHRMMRVDFPQDSRFQVEVCGD